MDIEPTQFTLSDPAGMYPEEVIVYLVQYAIRKRYPLEAMNSMTVRQLDLMLHGVYDA